MKENISSSWEVETEGFEAQGKQGKPWLHNEF